MDYILKKCMQEQVPEVLSEKGVYKNFANFTGKQLCLVPFVINQQLY